MFAPFFFKVSEWVLRKRLCPQTEAAQFDLSWKVPAIIYYAKRNYHTKYDLRSKMFRHEKFISH